ncbi:MAG TPA: amino acid permease [Victivallales bacterium]|nr:amino acid permease [Victivallales bacterium]
MNKVKQADNSSKRIKLNANDWGWVTLNIGMGIGAGIVFLPLQAGLVGFWIFLIAIVLAYPALYLFQRLFINTLASARACEDYPTIISEYLGRKWGVILGFIYFIMLIIWVFVYSQTLTNDSASYLYTYGITPVVLSKYYIYGLGVVIFLVFLAFKSEKLLFRLSKTLVVIILLILIVLGIMMIPQWRAYHIMEMVSALKTTKSVIVTLPFAMTSILFLQSLSPMVIAMRARYEDVELTRKKSLKIMNTSFLLLGSIVFFFAFSCTLSVVHHEAVKAFNENISFLAIIAKVFPGITLKLMGVALDIFAIMTSFFGVILAFHEACFGLYMNIFVKKKIPKKQVNVKKVSAGIIVFIILIAWVAIIINTPILYFTSICSPIFGIIGCFIPVILVYKSEKLKQYRGIIPIIVIITGILLVISPFLAFIH